MFDQRTIYKITDERGTTSTVTFDKLVADVFQMKVPMSMPGSKTHMIG
jgi:hypothetical protein